MLYSILNSTAQQNILDLGTFGLVVFIQTIASLGLVMFTLVRGFQYFIPKQKIGTLLIFGISLELIARFVTAFLFGMSFLTNDIDSDICQNNLFSSYDTTLKSELIAQEKDEYQIKSGKTNYQKKGTQINKRPNNNTSHLQLQKELQNEIKEFLNLKKLLQNEKLENIEQVPKSEILTKKSSKGLGEIQISRLKNNNNIIFALKQIKTDIISSYLFEEISQEYKSLNKLENLLIQKPLKVFNDNKSIYLVYQYHQNQSLRNFLNSDNLGKSNLDQGQFYNYNIEKEEDQQKLLDKNFYKLSIETKIKLSLQISDVMSYLHQQKIIHGHLHMENLLIDTNFNIVLADIGFRSLKKIQSLKFGYSNIGYYTAPEYLEGKNNIKYIKTPDFPQDVYSFAYILYELFYCRQPLKDLNITQLKKIIVEEGKRPKKDKNIFIPDQIETLIDNCWLADPGSRPTFQQIYSNLVKLSESVDFQFNDSKINQFTKQ
ncbi:Protein kinase-like domain [Pseudocohnilembus persalinus]|uniref:Protein kinase-like domain n=1 Tax=Pseudocohnilembus persalinus TaxID=266149 RepID=A0A0V0QJJ9_PSEPJ|nr:Protein kinase-like domain [Pseudocohnilembus persalinus]|eukprot:KRX02461.1 Protein kinase-like domain [Pseudocohnilembus persalinus]